MLVRVKTTDAPDVDTLAPEKFRALDRLCGKVVDGLSLQYAFYPSSFLLPLRKWFREADVIQLYNTHGGYFSHLALPFLSSQRPIVWRLSDMWPLTGHCVYSYECERWKTGCGHCPILSGYPKLPWDSTRLLWAMKNAVYARTHLTIVAPSQWIAGLARSSPLFKRFRVEIIPNGLDTQVFHPIDKRAARAEIGIEPDRRVILFSAEYITDRRKSVGAMQEALANVARENDFRLTLLLIGAGRVSWSETDSIAIKSLGNLSDDSRMAAAYSAADLFVLPARADNLPNTVLESMACGTPSVAFAVGGIPEAIRHLENGYLAQPQDARDLARGISLLLLDGSLRARMSARCREIAEREYTIDLQTRQFVELYEDLLGSESRFL
jgi:glycosyltransferase involved in cell wall biosynthesis